MKTILIPDIHTNHHWVEGFLKDKKYDQVIFMGDYFDHYNDTKESNAETAGWLIESLKKPDRIHLLGNHDIPYMFQGMYPCSGYTTDKFSSINSVMTQKDWEKLKAFHVIDPWIVSHAGINRNMSHSIYGFREEYLQKKSDEAFEQARAGIECDFFNAGMSRYGPAQVGGITWADWNVDFMPIDGINQVVGHTIHSCPDVQVVFGKGEKREQYTLRWFDYKKKFPRRKPVSLNVCIDCEGRYYATLEDGEFKVHKHTSA